VLGEAVTPPQHRSIALNIDFVIISPSIVIDVELHAADGGCTPSGARLRATAHHPRAFSSGSRRENTTRVLDHRPLASVLKTISASEVLITAPKSAHKYPSRRRHVNDDARLHPHGLSHSGAVFHMHTSG
jgi:hypothetical protein